MATNVGGLNIASVTVSSTTVPVSLIPPIFKSAAWWLRNRGAGETGSGGPINIFPYIGTLPGAVPSPLDVISLPAGTPLTDSLVGAAQGADAGLSVGYAAVLQSGASTIVDVLYR